MARVYVFLAQELETFFPNALTIRQAVKLACSPRCGGQVSYVIYDKLHINAVVWWNVIGYMSCVIQMSL